MPNGINRERYSKMRMRTIAEAEPPEAMARPKILVGVGQPGKNSWSRQSNLPGGAVGCIASDGGIEHGTANCDEARLLAVSPVLDSPSDLKARWSR